MKETHSRRCHASRKGQRKAGSIVRHDNGSSESFQTKSGPVPCETRETVRFLSERQNQTQTDSGLSGWINEDCKRDGGHGQTSTSVSLPCNVVLPSRTHPQCVWRAQDYGQLLGVLQSSMH